MKHCVIIAMSKSTCHWGPPSCTTFISESHRVAYLTTRAPQSPNHPFRQHPQYQAPTATRTLCLCFVHHMTCAFFTTPPVSIPGINTCPHFRSTRTSCAPFLPYAQASQPNVHFATPDDPPPACQQALTRTFTTPIQIIGRAELWFAGTSAKSLHGTVARKASRRESFGCGFGQGNACQTEVYWIRTCALVRVGRAQNACRDYLECL